MKLDIDDRLGSRELGATLTQYGAVEAWERMTYGGLGTHEDERPEYLWYARIPEAAIVTR